MKHKKSKKKDKKKRSLVAHYDKYPHILDPKYSELDWKYIPVTVNVPKAR